MAGQLCKPSGRRGTRDSRRWKSHRFEHARRHDEDIWDVAEPFHGHIDEVLKIRPFGNITLDELNRGVVLDSELCIIREADIGQNHGLGPLGLRKKSV